MLSTPQDRGPGGAARHNRGVLRLSHDRTLSPGRLRALRLALAILLSVLLSAWGSLPRVQSLGFDAWSAWRLGQQPLAPDKRVVEVAIDEASLAALPEPRGLLHRPLGRWMHALAQARPAAVLIVAAPPSKSYESLWPGTDAALLDGLRSLRAVAPLVWGDGIDGAAWSASSWLPWRAALEDGAGVATAPCADADGVVRRVGAGAACAADLWRALGVDAAVAAAPGNRPPSLAGAPWLDVRQWSGAASRPGVPEEDAPKRLAWAEVMAWVDAGDAERLRRAFAGRIVVLGDDTAEDRRYRLPAQAGLASAASVQAAGLRSLMSGQALRPAPLAAGWALIFVLALLGLRRWRAHRAAVAGLGVAAVAVLVLLAARWGYWLPPAPLLAAWALALGLPHAYTVAARLRERALLRAAFAGHVSPAVMRAILRGRITPQADGERVPVAVMFADVRGYTALSAQAEPAAVLTWLNAYYAMATEAVHAQGGTVDKFIGDGVMAVFGFPQPLASAERSAVAAALDLQDRLRQANARAAETGMPTLRVGIGIQSGEVLAGYVGSSRRREYTVIGDAVNAASRIEGLTKEMACDVLCSDAVMHALDEGARRGWRDLGPHAVRGRDDVHLWGWRAP